MTTSRTIYLTTSAICVSVLVTFHVTRIMVQDKELNNGHAVIVGETKSVAQLHRTELIRDVANKAQLLPDALIFGITKCGTYAVQDFMTLHPDVHVGPKESPFFTHYFLDGLDYYDDKYKNVPKTKFILEKSNSYWKLCLDEPGVIQKRIKYTYEAYGKKVKLVLVACDPALRTLSQYATHAANEKIAMSLEGYKMFLHGNHCYFADTNSNDTSSCKLKWKYAGTIKGWLKYFSRPQIYVVDGENLKKNPYEEIKALEGFLGVTNYITRDMFNFVPSKGFYCKVVNRKPRCLPDRKGRPHQEVPPSLIKRIKERLSSNNHKFSELINRKMTWA